jgi:hypothetical protein
MVFRKSFFEADERRLSFAVTLIIKIRSITFSVNQIFTVKANILFKQILQDRETICGMDSSCKLETICGSDSSPCSLCIT